MTPLSEIEQITLNGKLVLWYKNDDGFYVCKVAGQIKKFHLFGTMVQWIEKQTGVNYPW